MPYSRKYRSEKSREKRLRYFSRNCPRQMNFSPSLTRICGTQCWTAWPFIPTTRLCSFSRTVQRSNGKSKSKKDRRLDGNDAPSGLRSFCFLRQIKPLYDRYTFVRKVEGKFFCYIFVHNGFPACLAGALRCFSGVSRRTMKTKKTLETRDFRA